MELLLAQMSKNAFYFIGFAFMVGAMIVSGSILVEWGRSLYNNWNLKNKKDENGFHERRSPDKHLERAVTDLVEAMAKREKESGEFMKVWKEAHLEIIESIATIGRTQKTNWKILFDESLPFLHHKLREHKNG